MSTNFQKPIDRLAYCVYNLKQIGDTPTRRRNVVYANLLGQKAYFNLTDEDMGNIIGVSRNTYSQKIRSGRFWPSECQAFCEYFHKSFEYLFATEADIEKSIRQQTAGAG